MVRTLRTLLDRVPPHLFVAASAWGSRIISAVTGLFMVRVLTQSLGTEQYAAYAILGGMIGWFSLTDMGLGSSLQNFISERRGKGESYNEYVTTTALLGGVCLLFFVAALALSSDELGTAVLRKFDFFSRDLKRKYFLVMGLLSIGSAIGGISYRIWFAEQKGYLANLTPALASLVSFILVVGVSRTGKSHSLLWMLSAGLGTSAVLPMLIFIVQVVRKKAVAFALDWALIRPLFIRGMKFWLSGVLAACVLQIDYLVISQYLAPKDIVVYNLSSKIFLLIFFVYTALLGALWPVFAEATAANDWNGLLRHVRKTIAMGVVPVLVGTAIFALFRDRIIALLSPKEVVEIPYDLLALFGFYYLLRVWSDVFGVVLKSMSYMRPFVIYIPFQAAINILVQVVITREIGVRGVLVGLIASYLLTAVWIAPWFVFRRKRRMTAEVG